jgi:hypothetical protein
MTKLVFGEGKVWTQQGVLANQNKCLTFIETDKAHPVNSVPETWEKQRPEEAFSIIFEFKNIEGARTLQDELNELIAVWSRELATVVKQ